jgi:hypothetical protein
MTEEEQKQTLRNRGSMIGTAQGPLTLGGRGNVPAYGDPRLTGGDASVPPFPSNFSNIGPETTAKPVPFGGGGMASMGLGTANVSYPSRLGLGGGDYGTRFQFGAEEFGGARLPQATSSLTASPLDFNPPINFSGYTASPMEATIAGFTPAGMQPQQTNMPLGGGPVSMGIASTPTAEQQGKTEIKTPRGSMWATPDQAANVMTPRTVDQQSSRSPAEQQALLDNIRKNAPALNQQRTDWVMDTIQQRRDNPTTYTTPSGASVAVPTNRFGEPLKAWTDQLGGQGRLSSQQTQTASTSPSTSPLSNNSFLASTGFGAMQRAQQASMFQPLGRSPLYAGMGYGAAIGENRGMQPSRSMMAYNNNEDSRSRFRRILNLA